MFALGKQFIELTSYDEGVSCGVTPAEWRGDNRAIPSFVGDAFLKALVQFHLGNLGRLTDFEATVAREVKVSELLDLAILREILPVRNPYAELVSLAAWVGVDS